MKTVVALFILTLTALSLHIPPKTHLQTNNNLTVNTTYQNTIYFNTSFLSIQNKVGYVIRTLKMNNSETFKFMILRCVEIQAGLKILQQSLLKFNLLISQNNKFCPKVSTFNRTQIRRYMVYTQQKQGLLISYYPTCIDCIFIIPDLEEILQNINTYFKLVNRTLDGDFCNYKLSEVAQGVVNLNSSYFKNNLNVDNWYYGTTTKSDYKIYIFKRISTYNMTDCPLDRPFVKDAQQVCFNCLEGSIYNLGKQECVKCQNNQYFDIVTDECKECLGNKRTINHTIVCEPCILAFGEFYNATSGKCYKCVDNQNYIDKNDLKCKPMNCTEPNPRFNVTSQQCETCGTSEVVDPKNATLCIKTNYIGVCPKDTPIYDEKTHSCKACPGGTSFSQTLKKCQPNVTSVHTS